MLAREAKDFLVQQVAQQAASENLPFSDLERRMLYFTEGPEAIEDPVALNDEFEGQYNTAEYEAKVNGLFKSAYQRTKKDNPLALEQWDDAIKTLSEGDHYILVLLGNLALRRVRFRSRLRVGSRLAVLVFAVYGIWVGLRYFIRATGISPGIIFVVVVVAVSLTVAIKPQAIGDLTNRGILWILVFLLRRKKSREEGA